MSINGKVVNSGFLDLKMTGIEKILVSLNPVMLEDMDNVKLMTRIDTKYVVPVNRIPDLLTRMDGSYKVLEIRNNRLFSYFTTYLDTPGYMFFDQHVTGKPERSKVRFRKYETTGTTYLEVKRRIRKNRTIKWRIINDLAAERICDNEACEFINEHVPQKPLLLTPVLINRFRRVTLVGADFNERITIDFNLSYTDNAGKQIAFPSVAVIELKRERSDNGSPMQELLKNCYFHSTGFSKYCIGNAILNEVRRKNLMKPKLLLLKKIGNDNNRFIDSCS